VNAPIVRALLEDTLYQVFDNKIFRVLLAVVLLIVAPTFLIGFRENSVQVLFGWREIGYDQFLGFAGQRARAVFDPQARVIQGFQSIVVEGLVGTLGMVFSVSATAFFMPRMMEKGSADILFAKPVSRLYLMLSRYVAGLLFVGILALVLVFGIYLGLVVVSGYNDPGFLWGAVTLVYLFAILHAFSVCVGVFTRSTVAAIMLSLLLFMGSGCVHKVWRFRGYLQDTQLSEKLREQSSKEKDGGAAVAPNDDEAKRKEAAASSSFIDFMVFALDTAHYVLPKTTDADVLTSKLRKAIARRELVVYDETARVSATGNPEGFELEQPDSAPSHAGIIAADLAAQPAVWSARSGSDSLGRVELSRKSRLRERPADSSASASQHRPRRLGTNDAADELADRIKTTATPPPVITTRKASVDGNYAVFLSWSEHSASGERNGEACVFTFGDWMFVLDARANASWLSAHELAKRIDAFAGNIALGHVRVADDSSGSGVFVTTGSTSSAGGSTSSAGGSVGSPGSASSTERWLDPSAWYEQRFGWTAELPYNAWFSIASSVAFALIAFGFAWLKLRRTDF
jgi:ABC-type transport system involved in multi-copper enzyme maturation permease subunit